MSIRKLTDEPTPVYTGESLIASGISELVERAVERFLGPLVERVERLEERSERNWRPFVVSQAEACELLCCSDETLRQLRADGRIEWHSYMSRPVYNLDSIERFLAAHKVEQ